MMGVGIAVFLLFKYFNSKSTPPSRRRGQGSASRFRGNPLGARGVEEEGDDIRAQIQRLQQM